MPALAASHTKSASSSVMAIDVTEPSSLAPPRPWWNQEKAARPHISSSITTVTSAINTPISPFSPGRYRLARASSPGKRLEKSALMRNAPSSSRRIASSASLATTTTSTVSTLARSSRSKP